MTPATSAVLLRLRGLACAAALASTLGAAGCQPAGRSVLQASVTADPSVTGVATVDVVVTQSGRELARETFSWTASGIKVGVYLASSVSGDVKVSAFGLAGGTTIAQSLEQTVRISPGQDSPEVELRLLPYRPGADGGADASADAGSDTGGSDTAPPPDATVNRGSDAASDAPADTAPPADAPADTAPADTAVNRPADTGGDAPAADAGNDGSTAARSWRGAGLVETNANAANDHPTVTIDLTGEATVVWRHGGQIWANRVDTTTGVAGTEGPVGGTLADNPQVGVDGSGVATVIWEGPSSDASAQGIWSSTSTGSSTWSAPYRISSGVAFASSLAVSANGVAIATWTENTHAMGLNPFIVMTSYRLAGGQWTAPKAVIFGNLMDGSNTDSNDRLARVAIDGSGNGFAIWQQPSPTVTDDDSVFVSRFTPATGFAPANAIETYTAGAAQQPNIAVNAAGSAVAVWLQIYSDHQELWGRAYTGGAWQTPVMISGATYVTLADVPGLAIDAGGNGTVAWVQGSTTFNARIARHRAGQAAWDMPVMVESDEVPTDSTLDDPAPRVAVDGAGNAIVLWRKLVSATLLNLYAASVDPSGAVGTALRLDADGTRTVIGQRLAVAPGGTAIAVWYHSGDFNIRANVFR